MLSERALRRKRPLIAVLGLLTTICILVLIQASREEYSETWWSGDISGKNFYYHAQEESIEVSRRQLDDIGAVREANSDPLPARRFPSHSARSMCFDEQADCVQPFVYTPSLFVVSPRYQMAGCSIQKSMSTVLSAIFCYLSKPTQFVHEKRNILREFPSIRMCGRDDEVNEWKELRKQYRVDEEGMKQWGMLLIARDPVDRFLSAFVDRCVRINSCTPCGMNMTCALEHQHRRFVEYTEAQRSIWPRTHANDLDIHTYPQNWRCGTKDEFSRLEQIKYSNNAQETLTESLLHFFMKQGVEKEHLHYIKESLNSGTRTVHSTFTSKTRRFLEERLRNSPYLMELIVRIYYHDYKSLHYDLPEFKKIDM